MAIDIKPILGAGLAAQAGALAISNVKLLDKKKVKSKDLFKMGVRNIVAIPLLGAEANIIAGL